MSRFFGNNVKPVTQHDVEPAPPPDYGKETIIVNGSLALTALRERSLSSIQESLASAAAERLRR